MNRDDAQILVEWVLTAVNCAVWTIVIVEFIITVRG